MDINCHIPLTFKSAMPYIIGWNFNVQIHRLQIGTFLLPLEKCASCDIIDNSWSLQTGF